jgi:hypothetical protein
MFRRLLMLIGAAAVAMTSPAARAQVVYMPVRYQYGPQDDRADLDQVVAPGEIADGASGEPAGATTDRSPGSAEPAAACAVSRDGGGARQ